MNRLRCLLALILAGGLLPAQDDVVFHSDVSLVRVDAQVVDGDNRAITGLRVTDFILREEGRPQPIRNFASENMPVDVLLLLDVSASMRPHVQRIASAGHQALRELGRDDRVAIMVFDRSTRVRSGFRKNLSDVENELERLLDQESFRGGTDITRAMFDATDYVRHEGRRDARRAIVIVTDDQTEFDRDVEGVSRALTRADAVQCAILAPDAMRHRSIGSGGGGGGLPGGGIGGPLGGIILGRPRGPYGNRGPGMGGPHTKSAGTSEIVRLSGGDSMSIDDAYAFESTLSRIRRRYALYFNLPAGVNAGEERHIQIQLAANALSRYPGAEVRYRTVYMASSGSSASPDPVMITGAQSAPSEADSIARRRRVSGGDTGSHDGPLVIDADPTPAPQQAQPQPSSSAAKSNPAPTDTADQNKPGGWRKATPDDVTH